MELNNYTIRNSTSPSLLLEPNQNTNITFSYENLDLNQFHKLNIQQKLDNKESLTDHELFLKYKFDFEHIIKYNTPLETKKFIFNTYFSKGNKTIQNSSISKERKIII